MTAKKWLILLGLAAFAFAAAPSASFAGAKGQKKLPKNLAAMHGEIAAVSAEFSNLVPSGLARRAKQAQRDVKGLSKDDLALLGDLLAMAPNWRMVPSILESALEALASQAAAVQAPPPNCPAGLPGGIRDWYIARDVAQGLDFAQIFAPDDLVTVVAGTGGTVGPHPIKIALQVAFEGAQTAALVLEQIYFINDECETDAHRELLRQVDDKLDEVEQQFKIVKAAQRQIMRLLLTPQGRRTIDPDVLTCTGDDCPQVIACPGGECSFPIEP